ncbi:porin family protein [Granulicella cerasi]|uniref:Porin family protein n=1 Tax=Granulicella cerasi TaxID=741063 RepID=A0ABW1Z608_9BACT|nr:porin family protein [Granulicella cerasi]
MSKLRSCLLALGTIFLGASAMRIHAQAIPTATRVSPWQVGGGISYGSNDEFKDKVTGYTIYGTYDLTYHLGLEASYQSMSITTPNDFAISSFLIGPRYVFHYRRYDPYVKIQIGEGSAKAQLPYVHINGENLPASSFAIGLGGGVDVRLSQHFSVRGDYTYQDWTSFKPNGLNPYAATIGVSYHLR